MGADFEYRCLRKKVLDGLVGSLLLVQFVRTWFSIHILILVDFVVEVVCLPSSKLFLYSI